MPPHKLLVLLPSYDAGGAENYALRVIEYAGTEDCSALRIARIWFDAVMSLNGVFTGVPMALARRKVLVLMLSFAH